MAQLSGLGTLAQSYRWIIFGLVALVTVAAGSGLTQLKFDRDPRVYFGETTDDRVLFDTFEENYGRINSAVFVLQRDDEGELGIDALKALQKISKDVSEIDGVVKTTSVADLPLIEQKQADNSIRRFSLKDLDNPSEADYEAVLKKIEDKPDDFEKLFAKDQDAALVSVTLQLPGEEDELFNDSIDRIKQLKDDINEDFDDLKVVITGDAMLPSSFDAAFKNDLKTLMPIQFGAMILFLFLCYRSPGATFSTLALLIVSIV
ncbi:MAG: MMPL family transporter, partial [Pseudomonadota bacterium]